MSDQKHLVLILRPLHPSPELVIPHLESLLPKDKYEIVYKPLTERQGGNLEGPGAPTEDELARAAAFFSSGFPKQLTSAKQVPNLKLVQLASAGWNHIEGSPFYQNLSEDSPLIIATTSGIHVVPIGEHVLALLLSLTHALNVIIPAQVSHPPTWYPMSSFGNGGCFIRELRGLTMGVLGYGHIGRETARIAKYGFGMKIRAANRSGKKETIGGFLVEDTGDVNGDLPEAYFSTSSPSSLHEFYSTCDVIVNTLPGTPALSKFCDEQTFRSMKNDAYFINIGRGSTVDQEALIKALEATVAAEDGDKGKEGDLRIGSAGLDVTVPEPLEPDNKLWGLKNVVISPHMSGGTNRYFFSAVEVLAINLRRILEEGKGGINVVRGRGEYDS